MSNLFSCPPPSALASIPSQACPERFDQIVKLFIQRRQSTPSFTEASILLEATWTPLLAASDGTKIIKTPLIPNMVIAPGELLKEGGNDNTTINGIPKLLGRGFAPVTATIEDVDKDVRAGLRALATESALQPGFTNLWAYFVNRFGQIIGSFVEAGSPDRVAGIPVYNFAVGDVGTEGFNRPNVANLSFDLAPGWSDNLKIYTPTDFNGVTL